MNAATYKRYSATSTLRLKIIHDRIEVQPDSGLYCPLQSGHSLTSIKQTYMLEGSFMITAENIFDNFKYTMSGLERGLQVMHITTPAAQLLSCQHDEDIATVLTRSDLKPFDQIPVKKQETIIGLLKKRECPEEAKGVARDNMQPLREKILV